jgi:hypothetical protein
MKAAARQFLVTVAALGARTFTEQTGGEKKSEVTKWRDGGAISSDNIFSPPETSDVVVKNAYDPDVDGAMLSNLLGQVGVLSTTITKVPLFGDMSRIAGVKPFVYTGAVLAGVKIPDVNANSGEAATYELTFAVNNLN